MRLYCFWLILLTWHTQLYVCYRCSPNPLAASQLIYHNGEQQDVKILTSSREESRWHFVFNIFYKILPIFRLVASVFRILVTEVLGYDISLLVQPDYPAVFTQESQFSQLSSCKNELWVKCHEVITTYSICFQLWWLQLKPPERWSSCRYVNPGHAATSLIPCRYVGAARWGTVGPCG